MTRDLGVNKNHTAAISPPKKNVAARNTAQSFANVGSPRLPNAANTVAAPISSFAAVSIGSGITGSSISSEHNAPNAAPAMSLMRVTSSCR